MRRHVSALAALLLAASIATPAATASFRSHHDRDTILEFETMASVSEPFVGATNPIHGVPGGGLPWEIDRAEGELRSDGRIEVEVKGLVLARRAPVPEATQGTNPVASFKAIVSCTTSQDGAPATVNVSTELAPASARGNAEIEGQVDLPSPCFAPIVFVTSPTGSWFAVTGL